MSVTALHHHAQVSQHVPLACVSSAQGSGAPLRFNSGSLGGPPVEQPTSANTANPAAPSNAYAVPPSVLLPAANLVLASAGMPPNLTGPGPHPSPASTTSRQASLPTPQQQQDRGSNSAHVQSQLARLRQQQGQHGMRSSPGPATQAASGDAAPDGGSNGHFVASTNPSPLQGMAGTQGLQPLQLQGAKLQGMQAVTVQPRANAGAASDDISVQIEEIQRQINAGGSSWGAGGQGPPQLVLAQGGTVDQNGLVLVEMPGGDLAGNLAGQQVQLVVQQPTMVMNQMGGQMQAGATTVVLPSQQQLAQIAPGVPSLSQGMGLGPGQQLHQGVQHQGLQLQQGGTQDHILLQLVPQQLQQSLQDSANGRLPQIAMHVGLQDLQPPQQQQQMQQQEQVQLQVVQPNQQQLQLQQQEQVQMQVVQPNHQQQQQMQQQQLQQRQMQQQQQLQRLQAGLSSGTNTPGGVFSEVHMPDGSVRVLQFSSRPQELGVATARNMGGMVSMGNIGAEPMDAQTVVEAHRAADVVAAVLLRPGSQGDQHVMQQQPGSYHMQPGSAHQLHGQIHMQQHGHVLRPTSQTLSDSYENSSGAFAQPPGSTGTVSAQLVNQAEALTLGSPVVNLGSAQPLNLAAVNVNLPQAATQQPVAGQGMAPQQQQGPGAGGGISMEALQVRVTTCRLCTVFTVFKLCA